VLWNTDCVEQWTEITRRKYERAVQRYAGNLDHPASDARELRIIKPIHAVRAATSFSSAAAVD
jgi:hypothetical protein